MKKRVLNLSGGFNFRDMGGYATENGLTVKWNKLVRSGFLTELTDDDLKKLHEYGIRMVIDLRTKNEIKQFPDRLHKQFKYVHLPIFSEDETESQSSVEHIQRFYTKPNSAYQKMMRTYRVLVIDHQAQAAYRKFFEALLMHGNANGILFHCSAGKDRTGMCAILLLSALGVRKDDLQKDYMLTNKASISRIKWRINEAQKMGLGINFVESVKHLVTVQTEYFDQLMGILEYEYGGVIQYLESEIHLTSKERDDLKRIYLEQ